MQSNDFCGRWSGDALDLRERLKKLPNDKTKTHNPLEFRMAEIHLDAAMRSLVWKIAGIHSQLEVIHGTWAELLGISEPQWLILMAVDDLDQGNGVAGTEISAKLRIHPAFVTNQTKSLEKTGFLTRQVSQVDARFVLMSLTPKARADMAALKDKREALNASILGELSIEVLKDLDAKLGTIARNAERAARILAIDK